MAKVTLKGLNIRQAKGKWYVSRRTTGESLIKGFVGTRKQLTKAMQDIDFLVKYSSQQKPKQRQVYKQGTFGEMCDWWTGDDLPIWQRKKQRTKDDYLNLIGWLKTYQIEIDETSDETMEMQWVHIHDITTEDIITLRDYAYNNRSPRFADYLVAVLSSMFKDAKKSAVRSYRQMEDNPATGIEKLYKANKSANRDWTHNEFDTVMKRAPERLRVAYALARYAGMRGQSIQLADWIDYQDDPYCGRVIGYEAGKNGEWVIVECPEELIDILDAIDRTSTRICVNSEKVPWKTERVLQKASSDFIKKIMAGGLVRPGLTLHGLRTTFASRLKETIRAENRAVAKALGDRSERMGRHYSRFADNNVHSISSGKNEK